MLWEVDCNRDLFHYQLHVVDTASGVSTSEELTHVVHCRRAASSMTGKTMGRGQRASIASRARPRDIAAVLPGAWTAICCPRFRP